MEDHGYKVSALYLLFVALIVPSSMSGMTGCCKENFENMGAISFVSSKT
jgi:hypothetical protein